MRNNILLISIIVLGIFIRFYRFPELLSFSYEQALALEASGKMVQTGKISLIGVEYFIRQTSAGHSFFNSAFYLYPLTISQKIFGYDPLITTVFFAILNIAAGIGLYFFLEKYLHRFVATSVLALYLFSPTMVDISRSIWHVNLLAPVTVLSIWLIYKSITSLKPIWFILLGLSLGLGAGFNISFALGTLIVLFYCGVFLLKKHKLLYLIYIFIGIILGNLPTLLFDLRHNFYNTVTFLTFLSETFTTHNTGFSFAPYHFIYFLVPIFILLPIVLSRLLPSSLVSLSVLLYILVSIPGWGLANQYPKGMPAGTNLETIKKLSHIIALDSQTDFEVASILDGETRAENIRYFLEFVDNKPSMSADKYPEAKALYVVSYLDQDPLTKSVWELDSIRPARISQEWKINELIKLTKLEKL
ncbi:MAG: hypothetical protein ACD_61C00186G0005 [uncultured bacterium]|nr:MAG: hypothetical protein ACD_61C00186G0005 [uncultured bacterium]